jgi:hypothetical protein
MTDWEVDWEVLPAPDHYEFEHAYEADNDVSDESENLSLDPMPTIAPGSADHGIRRKANDQSDNSRSEMDDHKTSIMSSELDSKGN